MTRNQLIDALIEWSSHYTRNNLNLLDIEDLRYMYKAAYYSSEDWDDES